MLTASGDLTTTPCNDASDMMIDQPDLAHLSVDRIHQSMLGSDYAMHFVTPSEGNGAKH